MEFLGGVGNIIEKLKFICYVVYFISAEVIKHDFSKLANETAFFKGKSFIRR
jgi:hypothetical protein